MDADNSLLLHHLDGALRVTSQLLNFFFVQVRYRNFQLVFYSRLHSGLVLRLNLLRLLEDVPEFSRNAAIHVLLDARLRLVLRVRVPLRFVYVLRHQLQVALGCC